MLVLLLICLTGLGANAWNEKEISNLVIDLSDRQYIACLSVLYPRGSKASEDLFRLTKALQNGSALRQVRASPFHQPGVLYDWRGCAKVMYILLGWLPNSQKEFSEFTNSPLTNDPVWLVFLENEKTAMDFIGKTYVPYPARLLLAKKSGDLFHLEEAWQVSMGYATHVVLYATWSLQHGFFCYFSKCAFHPRKDLEGALFRASTKDDMPISEITHHPIDKSLYIGGYFGDIFYEIASQLNATPVIIPATENATGSARSNGSWMGLIGMMQRNETDFGVGPMSIQYRVLEVIDFLKPLLKTNFQVFFKQDGTVVEWDAYITPFGKFVWRLIFLWFFIGALTLNFFYRVGIRYGQENRAYAWEFSKINSFLTFFKAFCQQGSHLMPHSLSCRGLYLTGYLTSTILVTAYSAALISKLTLQEPLRPFDSLETFLEDGSYTLTAIVASTDYTYFSEASDMTLKLIYKQMMEHVPADKLPTGKENGLIQVCEKSKWALFITFAVTQITAKEFALSRKCQILHFRNPLGTVFLTIGVRKQMPYSRLIGIQLQTMSERGLLNRLRTKEWPLKSNNGLKTLTPQVEIQQVVQIHCLLIIGMIISVLILAVERASVSSRVSNALRWFQNQYGLDVENITTALFLIATAIVVITVIVGFV